MINISREQKTKSLKDHPFICVGRAAALYMNEWFINLFCFVYISSGGGGGGGNALRVSQI